MKKLLEVKDLVQWFDLTTDLIDRIKFRAGKFTLEKKHVNAVNGVSFSIGKGEVFGLVGESGCGKSTTAKTIARIFEPKAGEIRYRGEDISKYGYRELLPFRRKIQMIFQDPYASLNPRQKLADIISEPMLFHQVVKDQKEAEQRVLDILEKVGLNREHATRYPHQFSGGQRQRIGSARALAVGPEFIIADEPVSALDVSIQAQILNILMDLRDEFQLSYLFIAHDLSVVKHISDRLGVMYLGYIVETGGKDYIFQNPSHPYTRALFAAVPTIDEEVATTATELKGQVPNPIDLPSGCCFQARCPDVRGVCYQEKPPLKKIDHDHYVACHLVASK